MTITINHYPLTNNQALLKLNPPFTCEHCQTPNPPAPKTCRNHCLNCLFSKHVDQTTPGDRASTCQSLMYPHQLIQSGNKGFQIIHQCLKCQKQIPNKTAEDDNINTIIKLLQTQQ